MLNLEGAAKEGARSFPAYKGLDVPAHYASLRAPEPGREGTGAGSPTHYVDEFFRVEDPFDDTAVFYFVDAHFALDFQRSRSRTPEETAFFRKPESGHYASTETTRFMTYPLHEHLWVDALHHVEARPEFWWAEMRPEFQGGAARRYVIYRSADRTPNPEWYNKPLFSDTQEPYAPPALDMKHLLDAVDAISLPDSATKTVAVYVPSHHIRNADRPQWYREGHFSGRVVKGIENHYLAATRTGPDGEEVPTLPLGLRAPTVKEIVFASANSKLLTDTHSGVRLAASLGHKINRHRYSRLVQSYFGDITDIHPAILDIMDVDAPPPPPRRDLPLLFRGRTFLFTYMPAFAEEILDPATVRETVPSKRRGARAAPRREREWEEADEDDIEDSEISVRPGNYMQRFGSTIARSPPADHAPSPMTWVRPPVAIPSRADPREGLPVGGSPHPLRSRDARPLPSTISKS